MMSQSCVINMWSQVTASLLQLAQQDTSKSQNSHLIKEKLIISDTMTIMKRES